LRSTSNTSSDNSRHGALFSTVNTCALAALAVVSVASAQSTLTIKGTFDPSLVSQKNTYGNGNSVTQIGQQNNRQGTSQITFFGTEDLGGGLKANFLYESDFNSTQQAGLANGLGNGGGEIYVGLSGGFGSLKVGAPNLPSLTTQTAANPFGTKIGSGFGAMNAGKVRKDNTMRFDSPAFSGFSAAIAYSTETKVDANPLIAVAAAGAMTDIALFYANGPLTAGINSYTVAGIGAAANNKLINTYVTYDLGMVKLGAGMYTEKDGAAASATVASGGLDSQATNFSVSVPMGAVTLMANYGKKNDKSAANNDRTVTAIGAKYDLSKRTSVYARLVSDKTDGAVNAALAAKSTYTLAGIQHNF
jgi:predicted porin